MGSFGWLDYSEHERRQAMAVIDQFREEETRDELGLGTIRDPLSDLMFPGTSTIETRARYYLFVPWVYQEMERKRCLPANWKHQLRQVQGRLRDALIDGGEETGVIGFRAGLHVQRLPSSVYWAGLRQWGILRFGGSEDEYARRVQRMRRRSSEAIVPDGGEGLDVAPVAWDPHLPEPPEDWLDSTSFQMPDEEREYLIDRIANRFPRSLLAHLLLTRQSVEPSIGFAWDVPWNEALAPYVQKAVTHARNFSDCMHGAALLYNLLLAEGQPGGGLVEHYRGRLLEWRDRLTARQDDLRAWSRQSFWSLIHDIEGRVPLPTRQFVDAWLALTIDGAETVDVAALPAGRQLVSDRERRLKRGRARIGNVRAIENWSGAAGSEQLDYRWSRPVRAIVNDLLGGGTLPAGPTDRGEVIHA